MAATISALRDDAELAYDAVAAAYDTLTASYPYDAWLASLEELALRHGLRGRRLLDVACGTGKSFEPLRRRGYDVVGCDVSREMLERAAAKAPGVPLHHADMRALPRLGTFDLVTCLDDSLNYLLEPEDLRAALEGIARQLAPHGVAVWDLNTLAMYRSSFSEDWVTERDGTFVAWRGAAGGATSAGGEARAVVEAFARTATGTWERSTSEHRQRHWPEPVVVDLAARAGLRVLSVTGQRRGAVLGGRLDELVHTKAVYVARRANRHTAEEVSTLVGSP
jgi:SAM-dependent methyltransferase